VTFGSDSQLSRIDESAFRECRKLTSICIPSSVQIVGASSFKHCQYLSDLTFELESRVARIDEAAFSDCSSLTSVCVPSSVRVICKRCFRDCNSIRIPSWVQRLCGKCFYFCSSLSIVTFEGVCKLSQLDNSAFSYCAKLQSICIPADAAGAFLSFFLSSMNPF
jgi:hypothetical protein